MDNSSALKSKKVYVGICCIIILLWAFWKSLPNPLFNAPFSKLVLDKNRQLLQAKISDDGQWRFEQLTEVPDKFKQAIIEFEDKRFYYHPGFDPLALSRALYLNLKHGSVKSGGSTLSMQVIRMARNKPRNVLEKCIEIFLAFRLECSYSKEEILQLYASHAPFGGNVVGLEAAAWRYFGRSATQLSWSESCCLAVLPNSPSLVRPDKNRQTLKQKRDKLLEKLKQKHLITQEDYSLALLEPIPQKPLPLPNHAPNFLSSLFDGALGEKPIKSQVLSSIDLRLQSMCNQILEQHHQQLKGNGINNIACLILDIEQNKVLSYCGNVYHPNEAQLETYVDMIPALRSPGSTLKPLLYAALLQDGSILPKTLQADIPTQISGYMPQNFDLQYDGAVPANEALARSLNVPAVKQLQVYRTERFYYLLRKLGIKSLNKGANHYGLSLILGGGENSMWEISNVYASMARLVNHYGKNSGKYLLSDMERASFYHDISPKNNIEYFEPILKAGAIYQTFEAMQDLVRPGEEQYWSQYISSRRIAWKTGTSYGFRDAWAIGLTPKHVVCIWVGNADGEGRPGLTGISTAAPVLFDVIKTLPASRWFDMPYDDMQKQIVCTKSGNVAGMFCEQIDTQWANISYKFPPLCSYHKRIHTDINKQFRVSKSCENESQIIANNWFVLPPTMEFYYKAKHANYRSLPPFKAGCSEEADLNMEVIYPRRLSKLFMPKEMDGKPGKIVFEVAHRLSNTKVFWHLNKQYLGSTQQFHKLGIQAPAGKHLLVVEDEFGERIELPFELVRSQ
ncbi:MAG: penicillin-binding protein 1C [Bacteroidia bacterium]|nr:penicillin-binding protein 1C [Bacteroidia bacterium]